MWRPSRSSPCRRARISRARSRSSSWCLSCSRGLRACSASRSRKSADMYLLRRAWAELRNEVFVLPSRILVLMWVVLVLALPAVYADPYVLRILTMTCIFAIFAASWDLLAGFTGQVNFGHALFFGVGAYGSALLSLKLQIPPWATIWAGAAL